MAKKRTSVTVQAILTSAKSAKAAGGYYGDSANAIDLVFNLKLGKPLQMPSWKQFRDRQAFNIKYELENQGKKALKKGETPAPVTDEEIDVILRPRYEKECASIARGNAALMAGATAYAIFFALVGSTINLTVSPAQQGFEEMLGPSAVLALPEASAEEEEQEDTPPE